MKHERNQTDKRWSADIKEQHEQLDTAIEALAQLINRGSDADIDKELHKLVDAFSSHYLFHTFTEEKLMYQSGYPASKYRSHAQQHKAMINELVEAKALSDLKRNNTNRYTAGEAVKKITSEFLARHSDHIGTSDKEFDEWLNHH